MDAKVGDWVYGTQCSTSAQLNMAGHPNILQPLKGHLQGVYLMYSSSKFNKMSKIELSVVAFFYFL